MGWAARAPGLSSKAGAGGVAHVACKASTPAGPPSLPRPLTCPTLPPRPQAFNPIDSDGAGVRDGHMNVSVEWC